MNLKTYLKKNNLSQYRFADDTGISRTWITRYILKKVSVIDLDKALAIVKATEGEVSLKNLSSWLKDKTDKRGGKRR